MTYFKSLFFNFLTVFFVNHILPGIEIDYYSKLPQIKGDLIFAFSLGFLNSLVYPICRFLYPKATPFKIGMFSFIFSFGAYSIINIIPLGIHVMTPGAFVWSGLIVWFASYLTNYLEFKRYQKLKELEKEITKRGGNKQ
ncbi:MAG: hypothetical protein COT84_03790 [Chlamydiae bacterium CG10_big_fil_rev_8_21_14_0_10_35_9]|nr:MAG: hypothetical protein COT84_03790 [Chlamydiae bacterium CG10_big_fil_rev_8_21_14_0_10_35_9]